jgi:phosphoesterase RecJ-like protein
MLWAMADAYQEMIAALSGCRSVLVTTHVRPDGDAVGTAAVMVMGLRKVGIAAEVLILSHVPRKYAFIFSENNIVHHDAEKGWPAGLEMSRFDALLVVDTGTWSQLPGLKEKLAGFSGPKLIIDHHLTQEGWADKRLVVTEAAAAGEIVAELLERWGIGLDKAMATALYLAIATDTGWFQFSNTRPYTLRLAAKLMECGVDTDRMYQSIYQNERSQRLALQTQAQRSLELLEGGRLAVMHIAKEDFQNTGATVGETEQLINVPMQVASVEVSLLLVEPPDGGAIRVSLRSKGGVDVARFAEGFGGGGHARAAGLKMSGGLVDAENKVVEAMRSRLNATAGATSPESAGE